MSTMLSELVPPSPHSPPNQTTTPCIPSSTLQEPQPSTRTLRKRITRTNDSSNNLNSGAHSSDHDSSSPESDNYQPEEDSSDSDIVIEETPPSDNNVQPGPSLPSQPAKRPRRKSSGGHADSEAAQKKQRTNGKAPAKVKGKGTAAKEKGPPKKPRKRLAPLQKVRSSSLFLFIGRVALKGSEFFFAFVSLGDLCPTRNGHGSSIRP